MENNIKNLEPKKVFEYFYDICQIPHGSGNLEGIVNYLVDFAKSHNLRYIADGSKNVIIYKDGSKCEPQNGRGECLQSPCRGELCEPVILQAHTDMVCVKTPSSNIDMSKDSLDIYVDNGYLKARGTSLGGDDGIGVAMILAILDDDKKDFPPIEALFTSDEETGMNGAIGVDGKLFKAKRLINIDSENEDELTVSCAGGSHCESELTIERQQDCRGECLQSPRMGELCESALIINQKPYYLYQLKLSNLLGGHSGMEIHKGRANAICETAYVLKKLLDENIDFYLASIDGGKFENVICEEAESILYVYKDDEDKFKKIISKLDTDLKSEYSLCDPNITITATRMGECLQSPRMGELCEPLTKESTINIINTLFSLPQGLIEVSQEFVNLPWTSLNLGVIKTENDKIILTTLIRSNDDLKRDKLVKKYKTIIESAGGKFSLGGEYPAWRYNKDSKLKNDMIATYKELFGKNINVVATHGGLECGLFMGKIPNLDAVSIGPTILAVHSTDERLNISSVENIYKFLEKCLLT